MLKKSVRSKQYNEDFRQSQVVTIFALVGMFITATMALIALFQNNLILTLSLFTASSIYFLGYYLHKKTNNTKLCSAIVLYSLYLLMFYLVFSGGVENTGPLWIYIVAPVSVFIQGLKRGLIDIGIFLLVICIIMFIPIELMNHAIYSAEFKLRLLYSFLTVTFLSALYEYSREQSYIHTLELTKKYQQLAHLDSLTHLSNRRDALRILEKERSRTARSKESLSIILCDIDHFKRVNDQYGHNAGDKVLIEIAQLFSSLIREQDTIARWGGEEFIFILPQTEAKNANRIAEKILLTLQKYNVIYQEHVIQVTMSMGIEESSALRSIDNIINSADKYLYQAKEAGRNQIFPKFPNE